MAGAFKAASECGCSHLYAAHSSQAYGHGACGAADGQMQIVVANFGNLSRKVVAVCLVKLNLANGSRVWC